MRRRGVPVMFVTSVVGAYGAVGWISGVDDLAEVEASNAALSTDDEWLKLVDTRGPCLRTRCLIDHAASHRLNESATVRRNGAEVRHAVAGWT